VLETRTIYASGLDRQGRPVVYVRIGASTPYSAEQRLTALIYTLERLIAQMPPGVEATTWILDFSEYSWTHQRPDSKQVSKQSTELLQDHYPERLGLSLLVNTPWYLSWLWRLVSPFMSAATKAKISVVQVADLPQWIAPERLDERYGGQLPTQLPPAPAASSSPPTEASRLAYHNQMDAQLD